MGKVKEIVKKGSSRLELDREDMRKIVRNALIFAAPALLVFLSEIQTGRTPDQAFVAFKVWLLNTAVDMLRKFMADNSK